jgi:putative CocE/NonD family hydrolase
MFPAKDPSDLKVDSDFPHRVIDEPTVWIEMSDGVRLAARIWRPEGSDETPVPAVLEMIPYRRRDGTLVVDEAIHPWFAGHGIAGLRVDLRGSGDSEGLLLDEYLPREQDDAMEIIAWIAAQPWCDGNVGMMGLSWGGFNSLQVAARRPPALKAIIAVGATVDRYNDDVHYKRGCLLNENLGWATGLFSFTTRPPDPSVVGEAWKACGFSPSPGSSTRRAMTIGSTVRSARTTTQSPCR